MFGSKYLAAAILKQVKDLEHDVIASFLPGWYATHFEDLILRHLSDVNAIDATNGGDGGVGHGVLQ